ncbi:MAG: hypothetical protein ABW019_00625 [Chitinophagaceae bacterium]
MAEEQPKWIEQVRQYGVLSPGEKLLLPMQMDALVVGAGYDKVKWKNTALNLLNLKKYQASYGLGKYLDKSAAGDSADTPIHPPGVHLHWILPRLFRHGVQRQQDGAPEFPLVPNRWLVIRTSMEEGRCIVKRQLVESDYLVRGDAADPNWLLLDRTGNDDRLDPNTSSYEAVQTGRSIVFDSTWTEKSTTPLFLTIMAPGDPAFAASYASCKGVFGYHDTMMKENGQPQPDGFYSYLVTGWYSDPSKDVLAGAATVDAWLERMQKYSLSLSLPADQNSAVSLPGGVLCHASVFSVEWKGATTPYWNDKLPDPKFTRTSIGHSALEALAPVIRANIPAAKNRALESFFAAFQYKMLSDYDSASGKEVLQTQVHTQSFNAIQDGSAWTVERKETPAAGQQKPGILPPLPANLSQLLNELNDLQAEYDRKLNELHSLQSQLYAYWFSRTWTYSERCSLPKNTSEDQARLSALRAKLRSLYARDASPKPILLAAIDALKERIPALKNKRSGLTEAAEETDTIGNYEGLIYQKYRELTDKLAAITDPALAGLVVKETKLPPFYLAKDPSIILTGMKNPEVPDKYKDDKALTARLAGQVIARIFYQRQATPARINIAADQLNDTVKAAFPANANIPAVIPALFSEMQLLNPALAPVAAELAYSRDGGKAPTPAQLKQLANELIDLMKNPDVSRFQNEQQPAKALPPGFAIRSWAQPWTPLFLEWETEWYPSYTRLTHEAVMHQWAFGQRQDGLYNNTDYVFTPQRPDKTVVKKYHGRIPLTDSLGAKIREVFTRDIPFLDSMELKQLQPLSQELSGLNNNLMMRENSTQLPPLSYDTGTRRFKVNEVIRDIDDQYTWNPLTEETGFFPFRGGHFTITALRVIDSFGQVLEVPANRITHSGSLPVIRDADTLYMQLPLRLTQPARLRFEWMAAGVTGKKTTADPATSPVCGWLLTNRLDKSLMVFDAAGREAGALKATGDDEPIRWMHAPGSKGPSTIDASGLHEEVKGIVKGILATNTGKVLTHLIREIDELQQKGFAKTSRQSITMSLPAGYPVAIVKAACQLQLKDLPPRYQGWDWETYDDSLDKVKFPVYIGDTRSKTNGLAGYFIAGQYNQLRLPYAYDRTPAHPYFAVNEKMAVSTAQETTNLLLLLDPRMGVHLSCGILPAGYYELPDQLINQAIEAMQVSFLVSPLLTAKNKTRMPLAALPDKEWEWIPAENTGQEKQVLDNIPKGVLSFEAMHIVEGWLKLRNKTKKPPQP